MESPHAIMVAPTQLGQDTGGNQVKLFFEFGKEVEMARYVAQLVREGVVFVQKDEAYGYSVELTGGY